MKKIISALLILTMLVSMVCVSTSAAGVHVNMNFESMEIFTSQFVAGAFYTEDNLLYGYAEAVALQTMYNQDDMGIFDNTGYTWLTYDTSITLAAADDDLSEDSRYVNLVYCNDNLVNMGREEDRYMMAFGYDMQEMCFRFTQGWSTAEAEDQLLEPVYKEINTDGSEFYTMGMSVDKNRIRCFYNNELIFDFQDTANDYLIASEINSPFLFWQNGNFIQISNITVADQGYLFPYGSEPVTSETTTAGGDDNVITTSVNTEATTTKETTTRIESSVVVKDDGETEIVTEIITEATTPAPAATNTGAPAGGSSTSTGDATFVVIAAMVATLGCALIIRKVNAQ